MVLEWISIITGASERFRRDDNYVDRFHHRYSVIVLVVFAVVSTTHQLVGNPITCWAPAEFQGGWIKYTNSYCWVQNTHFLPFEEEIPQPHEITHEIVYYQWMPFIFLGMALFFYLPSVVWTSFNSKAGVDSDNILESAETFRKTDKIESKDKLLRLITNQIHRFVGSTPKTIAGMVVQKQSVLKRLCCLCGQKFGNYLVLLYISTKVLYIANAFLQVFLLNGVLKTDYSIYGIEAIMYAMEEKEFLNHTIFPKVTMCNFMVRALGEPNTRRYTVQCLLPINLYTEKMFVFLWFWIVMVMFLTVSDLISWILKSALPNDRYGFIENSLIITNRVTRSSRRKQALCWSFVHDYLRPDGVFVLRLIGSNTNKLTSSEIIASIWDNWRDKQDYSRHPPGKTLDSSDSEDPDTEPINDKATLPLKPIPPPKPQKPPKYRPNVGPPPPPKSAYPSLDNVDGAIGYPTSPPPSAPMAPYDYS